FTISVLVRCSFTIFVSDHLENLRELGKGSLARAYQGVTSRNSGDPRAVVLPIENGFIVFQRHQRPLYPPAMLSLGLLEFIGKGGHDIKDVADHAIVGDFEYGSVLVFVDRH